MPITRKFRTTILNRAASDAGFRRQMLTEAVNELLAGDLEAGKAMLRDYINATITFQQLAKKLKKSDKSVHRMLGPRGNPRGGEPGDFLWKQRGGINGSAESSPHPL